MLLGACAAPATQGLQQALAEMGTSTGEPVGWQQQLVYAERLESASGGSIAENSAINMWFRKAAESGESEALLHAGCYLDRRGVAASQEEARSFIRKAAEMGNPDAILALAKFTAFGIGGERSEKQALDLIRQAYTIYMSPETRAAYRRANAEVTKSEDVRRVRMLRRLNLLSCGPLIQAWAKRRGITIDEIPGIDLEGPLSRAR